MEKEIQREKLPELDNSFLARRHIGSGELCISTIKRLNEKTFDFDVFLPSKGINLQRDFVWTEEQQQNLIESCLVKRYIPPISVIFTVNDVYQVIDGKQRLLSFLRFIRNEFRFCGYLYTELPKIYKSRLDYSYILAYQLCEYEPDEITDDEKIEWFKWINYAGTPQDLEHMEKLINSEQKNG